MAGFVPCADNREACSTHDMQLRGSRLGALLALLMLWLSSGCDRPELNRSKLPRLRAEAYALMRTHPVPPTSSWRKVPKAEWPPTIASFNPEWVTVTHGSVDILTRPFFDGGWGYNVPRSQDDLPMPADCYSEPSKGVFWHGPC